MDGRKEARKENVTLTAECRTKRHTQLVTTPFPKGVSFLKLGTVIFRHAAQNFTTKTISVRSSCAF
jgi:hypothetical protein